MTMVTMTVTVVFLYHQDFIGWNFDWSTFTIVVEPVFLPLLPHMGLQSTHAVHLLVTISAHVGAALKTRPGGCGNLANAALF